MYVKARAEQYRSTDTTDIHFFVAAVNPTQTTQSQLNPPKTQPNMFKATNGIPRLQKPLSYLFVGDKVADSSERGVEHELVSRQEGVREDTPAPEVRGLQLLQYLTGNKRSGDNMRLVFDAFYGTQVPHFFL